ncbi:hypothetical protein ACFQ9X_20610 [Catenulispora yoronensis]
MDRESGPGEAVDGLLEAVDGEIGAALGQVQGGAGADGARGLAGQGEAAAAVSATSVQRRAAGRSPQRTAARAIRALSEGSRAGWAAATSWPSARSSMVRRAPSGSPPSSCTWAATPRALRAHQLWWDSTSAIADSASARISRSSRRPRVQIIAEARTALARPMPSWEPTAAASCPA